MRVIDKVILRSTCAGFLHQVNRSVEDFLQFISFVPFMKAFVTQENVYEMLNFLGLCSELRRRRMFQPHMLARISCGYDCIEQAPELLGLDMAIFDLNEDYRRAASIIPGESVHFFQKTYSDSGEIQEDRLLEQLLADLPSSVLILDAGSPCADGPFSALMQLPRPFLHNIIVMHNGEAHYWNENAFVADPTLRLEGQGSLVCDVGDRITIEDRVFGRVHTFGSNHFLSDLERLLRD